MERFLGKPENVCRGPYISIGLPFRSGNSGPDHFRQIPMSFTPHLHQERAFARLSPPYYQSTLVATGTGSGKTECFLLPILEHCRLQQGTPGIKAILIYPMNALASDQAKRIAELIHSTPALRGKVTAGLYIGSLDETPTGSMGPEKVITDKRILREAPPDLLLTNYKMLDYLLVQPEAQKLWSFNEPETLRYIVVDEFHTFDGAQGTDLACLIRRLKHRLNTPPLHLVCVGTSATLGSKASKDDMLGYASTIFQEPFEPKEGALIEEDRITAAEFLQDALLNVLPIPGPELTEQLRPGYYPNPTAYIRAQAQLWLQDSTLGEGVPIGSAHPQISLWTEQENQLLLTESSLEDPLTEDWRIRLGEELQCLPIAHNLIRLLSQDPQTYQDLLDILGRRLHLPNSDQSDYPHLLLDSILSLFSVARRRVSIPGSPDRILPWVTLRVQLWYRELRRMVATVESLPELQFSDDLPPSNTQKTLPVLHCRDCGATGWGGVRPAQGYQSLVPNDLQRFYREFFGRKPLVTFIFPCDEGISTADKRLCGSCLTLNGPRAETCQSCGRETLIPVQVPEINREEKEEGKSRVISSNDCPFCGSSNGLTILGAQAASLTSAMIGILYTSPYNKDKKLLTFSDSVQDAAHRAGFYGARTYRTTLRTAIAHTIANHPEGFTLADLLSVFPAYWQQQLGSAANYVATFLPNDLEWLREWETFVNSDQEDLPADSNLPTLVNERLEWEIVSQFGHRASIGPSLERSGSCSAIFEPNHLDQAVHSLHLRLTNEIEVLREVSPKLIRCYLLGILHHLRQRGGILQPITYTYISNGGNTYLLQKPLFMPRLGPSIPVPVFFANAAAKANRFEHISQPGKRFSWCEDWTSRLFASQSLLLKEQLAEILHLTVEALVNSELLECHACATGKAWGIPLARIQLRAGGTVLACDRCSHQLTTGELERSSLQGMRCLTRGCPGQYQPDPKTGLAYYRQLYGGGEVHRIVASEHTGLLDRPKREQLERRFINHQRRCDPNLISATSTLEMGINIGDLSTVLLCSIPPGTANFQQRIGRAGRREGNALISSVANATPHDLYFYAEPMRMLAGIVESAGCYLDASAILERQLTAFCLDNWVATGITHREFPTALNDVLNAIERQDQSRFPYNWLQFIQERQSELLLNFLTLFQDTVEEETKQQLRLFMERGEEDKGGLRWRILNRLEGVRQERTRLSTQIKNLSTKLKKYREQPKTLQDPEVLDELDRERAGFRGLLRSLNEKHILNFLTDEGLLPNYAFPEAGVTLRSILWRRFQQTADEEGRKYESFTLTYERPGALAIRELVPSGVFYAEGRKVRIDQIDLRLSEPEDWRLCRNCNYSVRAFQPEAHHKICPRCGDGMWSDQGRLRRMVRLRQVMATTSDRDSRFGDDSEDRTPGFFQRHMLVDFDPETREKTYRVKEKDFPFGIEYISRTLFREVNFGEIQSFGETVEFAGQRFTTQGFQVCRGCGKVLRNQGAKDHTISCQWRDKPDQAKALDILYLYRDFESEAIRLLMPVERFWTPEGLHSFIAALQLGLKRKFGGKVDHLRTLISEEPQPQSTLRKSFLYLFDSVPGGTGYLRQLIRNPDEFLDVFNQALAVLRACDCEDGCYNCLFAYRNSHDQNQTSRRTALILLSAIVKHWPHLEESSKGLSAIRLNSNFESELERRFIEAIRRCQGKIYQGDPPKLQKDIINGRAGYYLRIGDSAWTIETQVVLGQQDGVQIPSRADFLFRPASSRTESKPIVVFTDGWEYHRERITGDLQQRLAILRSGQFWCWSLSWDDVAAQLDPSHVIEKPDGLRWNPQVTFERDKAYQRYDCSIDDQLEKASSFDWLMVFLANPRAQQWQRWAMLHTLVQADHQTHGDTSKREQWQNLMTSYLGHEALDLWDPPPQFLCSQVGISDLLTLYGGVDLARHKHLDPSGSFVLMLLDETPLEDSKLLKCSWIEALRLLNHYQFLPHIYAGSKSGLSQGLFRQYPGVTLTQAVGSESERDDDWKGVQQLVIEEALYPALEHMSQSSWPLPIVGYELTDQRGAVTASAELAWEELRIAVTTAPEEKALFSHAGWEVYEIEEFLQSLDMIEIKLKEAKV